MKISSLYVLVVMPFFAQNHFPTFSPDIINVHKTYANDTESDIREIRREYTRINSLKLKAATFKYETKECVEGGEITYYCKK